MKLSTTIHPYKENDKIKKIVIKTSKSFIFGSGRVYLALLFCFNLMSFSLYDAIAQTEKAADLKLIEAAKEESKMVLYGSMTVDDSSRILRSFEKKYPFVKAELYRGMSDDIVSRVSAETGAKKYVADVIMIGGFHLYVLKKRNFLMKYKSPMAKYYSSGFFDPEGFWHVAYIAPQVIAYNTNLVKSADAPKSYSDLLDVKWKGKMGMYDRDGEWLSMLFQIMGRSEAIKFTQSLSIQNISFRSSKAILGQLLAAAETSVVVGIHGHIVAKYQAAGAPLEWVNVEPVPTNIYPISISIHAPHPNSAKLFVDFVLSREGQELISSLKRVPGRKDVKPDPPRLTQGIQLFPQDISQAEHYGETMALFRTIFLKK